MLSSTARWKERAEIGRPAHGLTVITSNLKPFEPFGIEVTSQDQIAL